MSSLFDNIDADKIKNKILYDTLYEYFEYNKEIKEDLIRTIIIDKCGYCPEIYEMILSDLDVEYLKNKVILLVIKNVGYSINVNYYIEPVLYHIYSKTGLDQKFIDDLFLVSDNGSENLIKILVEYGADYEKYGATLMKKAKKQNNYHVTNYVKKLLKNNDE
uniref:Ankyrin repeat-containing protein n=1 Tax=Borely moumouvirus TaxID=2712067 RepID=A0A6G6ACN2_9VIRU